MFISTPTYGSWIMPIVERWFSLLTQRQIKRGTHRSVRALETAIKEFLDTHNDVAEALHLDQDPQTPFSRAKSPLVC